LYFFEFDWKFSSGRILFGSGSSESIRFIQYYVACTIDHKMLQEYMNVRHSGASFKEYLEYCVWNREKYTKQHKGISQTVLDESQS